MLRAVAIGVACAIGAWWGRRIAVWFGFCILVSVPLKAQTYQGYPKVVMEDSARAVLIASWDSAGTNPYATERVFCAHVTVMAHKLTGQYLYMIDGVKPAVIREATPYKAIYKNCDAFEVPIHVHTAATCDTLGNCRMGGYDSYDCEPSVIDYRTLFSLGHAFNGLQCSREAVTWFYNPGHSLNKRR
jgi:hypothetical protein